MKNRILFLFVLAFFALQCQVDDPIQPENLAPKFKGHVMVSVKNPLDYPLKGVQLAINGQQGVTDDDGVYYFYNIDLRQSTLLTADKPGFFTASRRFVASANTQAYVEITLLPLTIAGDFNADAGAVVQVDDLTSIHFPANGVMYENGAPYTGEVTVYAVPIYPDNPNLFTMMPGSLEGITTNNQTGALITYGMVNVELVAEDGQPLQIATGQKAEIRLHVPGEILSKAPPTIATWYYDEVKGYWREDGQAILTGDQYVFDVTHFTVWNCDVWQEATIWTVNIAYANALASPAAGTTVCFSLPERGMRGCEKANSVGQAMANIPQGERVVLQILDPCDQELYSAEYGPFFKSAESTDVDIQVAASRMIRISGVANACGDAPVQHGYAMVNHGSDYYTIPINNQQGDFALNLLSCPPSVFTLRVFDYDQDKSSTVISLSSAPEINTGIITVCDEVNEYVRYTIQGFEPDYVFYFPQMNFQQVGDTYTINVRAIDLSGRFGAISFDFIGKLGEEHTVPNVVDQVTLPNGETGHIFGITSQLTEAGAINEYVRGNFRGKITAGDNGAGGPEYSDFAGTFSIIRTH